jgi:acetate kinase
LDPAAAADDSVVLVLNSGSSSLKFAVIEPESGNRLLTGVGERLASREAVLRLSRLRSGAVEEWLPEGTHQTVVARVLSLVAEAEVDGMRLLGAGHRVVHGGERFAASVLIDEAVVSAVRSFSHLAPLHNPANLAGVEAVSALLPNLPQVAVFDTAFHQTMPPHAFRYAVPEEWYTRHGVRRYGFHGTSHRFVSQQAATLLGRPVSELRLVTAHLGNGCSATAVHDGISIDTTMGLTPLDGLVMGTRSGDVDPGLIAYLAERTGMGLDPLTQALNTESGLLGLSGLSNDMRTVVAAAVDGNERATLALDVFAHRLSKAIAGLVVGLGRLDALVFTGGIGENSPVVRSMVLSRLGFLGLTEDPQANARHGRDTAGRISVAGPVVALVVPTDEELTIARDTARVIAEASLRPTVAVA